MDVMAHILLGVALFGLKKEVIIGSIAPDMGFLPTIRHRHLPYEELRKTRAFVFGQRFHTIFLWIPLTLLYYLFSEGTSASLYLMYSIYLHLFMDFITHRHWGPRFLWPLVDKLFPTGPLQWENKNVSITIYAIIITLLMLRFLVGPYITKQ